MRFWTLIFLRLMFFPLALVLLTGCGDQDWSSTAVDLGLYDEPPVPVVIDLVCDNQGGSTCTVASILETLDVVLPVVGEHSGVVRLWLLGNTVGSTERIASQRAQEHQVSSRKARRTRTRRFVETAKSVLLTRAKSYFLEVEPRNRSPLLESIVKIQLAGAPQGSRRFVIVMTDGLEVSKWVDLECPNGVYPHVLLEQLQEAGVIQTNSFRGTKILFSHMDLGEIANNRCDLTIRTVTEVREFWQTILKGAGVDDVVFKTEGVTAADLNAEEVACF